MHNHHSTEAEAPPDDIDQFWRNGPSKNGKPNSTPIVSIGKLVAEHPNLHNVVIDGLLRRGETCNVIAAPKVGKSWLAYDMALSTATGGEWLNRYRCQRGRVLLVDNELHPPTIAHRIPVVAEALSIELDEYQDMIDVLALRGSLLDLNGIARLLTTVKHGDYSLVILDAWYRATPSGVSENDNGQVAILYNTIDRIASQLGCAWINVHHASKGAQGDKAVTDVGAGAGSQSRAADSHVILRQHEEDGVVVLDAVVRSFPPVAPLALRWEWPCWHPADELDVTKLRGRLTKGEVRQSEKDKDGCAKIIAALAGGEKKTPRELRDTGLSRDRLQRLLDHLYSESRVTREPVKIRGNDTFIYSLTPPVRDVGD